MPTSAGDELVDVSAAVGGALAALMSMEAPPSSDHFSAEGMDWCEPEICCFDLASWPKAYGYEAESKCARCETLHALGQGELRRCVLHAAGGWFVGGSALLGKGELEQLTC